MAIKAKYAGKCRRCDRRYPVGTLIEKIGIDWYPVDCHGCAKQNKRLEILQKLRTELLEKHNVALGCWGIPEGAQYTFTRREWLETAKKHGIGTSEELRELGFYWAGLLDRDLSD